jgi:pimeloyl-ACP methyl ester carboxylesterase
VPSPPTTSLSRPAALIALSVVLALTLAGCGLMTDDQAKTLPSPTLAPSSLGSPGNADAPAVDLKRYYQQKPAWQSCREDQLCTTIEVPLDYAEPDAESIELSLLKVPAASRSQRVGSLLVNPGGPGGSGVNYAAQTSQYFGSELQQAFDIVGFDPRGVGESTPVQCLSDDALDEFVATDPDPDNAAEIEQGDAMLAEFGEGCVRESGDLASHVSTVEAAKDMDIIRAVLGDKKVSYFGASYGTFLGATYAELFPERVGRMVLDGAIDPSVSAEQTSLVQAKGFETALRAYVDHCVDAGDCFLGGTVDAGTQRIRAFLDDVEDRPLPGSGGRELTVGNAVLGIWAPLYNEGYWPILDAALESAFEGNGAALLALSDAYTSRGADGYSDNSLEALYAVNCLDQNDSIPASEVPAEVAQFEEASPTFGAIFAFGLSSCSQWPVRTGREPAPIHAEGAAPILVIGTSRDPATPLAWAEALAAQLESGALVSRDGDGHTGYNAGNSCVDETVESYLVSGKVPAADVNC